jgi:hypothetical protein
VEFLPQTNSVHTCTWCWVPRALGETWGLHGLAAYIQRRKNQLVLSTNTKRSGWNQNTVSSPVTLHWKERSFSWVQVAFMGSWQGQDWQAAALTSPSASCWCSYLFPYTGPWPWLLTPPNQQGTMGVKEQESHMIDIAVPWAHKKGCLYLTGV